MMVNNMGNVKEKKIKIVVDTHTHTLLCRHAFSTVTEVIRAAADRGLKGVGLTEHGPGYPGSVSYAYFNTYRDIPRELFGIDVFCGAEANVMDFNGSLDFTDEQLKKLDIVIVSCHKECLSQGSKDQVMHMFESVMKNPYIDIIGHPDNPIYPIDADILAKLAKKYNKALEINNSSPRARPGSEGICAEIILAAKKYGTLLSIGSDAHYHMAVGNFEYALSLLEQYDIPKEQIINTSVKRLKSFLDDHHKKNF